jgi:DNA-binding transcriptional LysR family regulator
MHLSFVGRCASLRSARRFIQSIRSISYIRHMNLTALDLNLLVALDALLAEASVGRAARRIGLSQPAASHALARLRSLLDDPLLVRAGARMELTPRAQNLRAPLAVALEQVRGLFESERFDPATSARRFVLLMPDLVVDLLMPALVERLVARAPSVRLHVAPWRGTALLHAGSAQDVDIVITCRGESCPGFVRQRLYADRDVIAVRADHPLTSRLRRLDVFLAARHVAVVGAGESEDLVDTWLRREGVERRVALTVPSYLAALRMAARTDLVAFAPGRLVASLAERFSLVAVASPLDPGEDVQFMFHPARAQADPASIWLRGELAALGRELDRSRPRRAS